MYNRNIFEKMDKLFQDISKDVEQHCKNIDQFNKNVIKDIDKAGNDALNLLLNVFSLNNNENKEQLKINTTQETQPSVYNPFSE